VGDGSPVQIRARRGNNRVSAGDFEGRSSLRTWLVPDRHPGAGIARIVSFNQPELFPVFGLPELR
jgi:hypothetical protein